MWKVHVVVLGKLFLLKIWRVVIFLILNLTSCKKVDTNSDKTNFFLQNHAFYKNFFYSKSCLIEKIFLFKIMLFRKKIFFEIVLFKSVRKTQKLRILRGKLNQNVIFCVQFFFQNRAF